MTMVGSYACMWSTARSENFSLDTGLTTPQCGPHVIDSPLIFYTVNPPYQHLAP